MKAELSRHHHRRRRRRRRTDNYCPPGCGLPLEQALAGPEYVLCLSGASNDNIFSSLVYSKAIPGNVQTERFHALLCNGASGERSERSLLRLPLAMCQCATLPEKDSLSIIYRPLP